MNWWKLYLWLLLFLVPFFPAKALYLVFFTLAIVYWAGGKLLYYAFSRVEITRTADKTRLFPGELGEVSIVFRNRTIMPIAWLSGRDHLPLALESGRARRWVFSLGPRAQEAVSYQITAGDRGCFTAGPLDISAGEPLGLHQFSTVISSYHNVVVYPRLYNLAQLNLPSRLPYGNVRTRLALFPDPTRLAGVRPYTPGDSRQSIHWKLTARTGDLQVKQLEHAIAVDTVIYLNLNSDDYAVHTLYPDSELAIETAAALGNHLARRGESFGLITNGSIHEHRSQSGTEDADLPGQDMLADGTACIRLPSRKGMPQLMRVLEALARVQCHPGNDYVSLLTSEAGGLAWGATFLVITPQDSSELVGIAGDLATRGYQVLIFVVGPVILHPQLLHRPSQAPLQSFRVRKIPPVTLDVV